jgi:hypothetical protein
MLNENHIARQRQMKIMPVQANGNQIKIPDKETVRHQKNFRSVSAFCEGGRRKLFDVILYRCNIEERFLLHFLPV